MTQQNWTRRARELARERELSARRIGTNDLGGALYKVPSGSHDAGVSYHVVTLWKLGGAVTCDCLAGCYGKPCGHAGAALIEREAEQRAESKRQSARAYRDMLNDDYPAYPC